MLVLKFHTNVFANAILGNDSALCCAVFTSQSFIKTVLHDITELVQLGAIVCNRIVITEAWYFLES